MFPPVYDIQTNAVRPVDHECSAPAPFVGSLGGVGKYDHREFQAFALVDRRNANDILAFADGLCFGVRIAGALHCFNIPEKSEQTAVADLFILRGFVDHETQVGDALFAHRQAAAVIVITCTEEKLLDQILQRHGPAEFLPQIHTADHRADLFAEGRVCVFRIRVTGTGRLRARIFLRVREDRLAEASLSERDPDSRQLFDGESEHNGTHR